MQLVPLTRDLVFVGGGHAHALVLRKWAMNPLPGARLTLINPGPTAPYTGMLPGHVAGHYDRDLLEIDLVRLARFAGARLVLDHAVDIDPDAQVIKCARHADIAYDVASVDIGITAQMPDIKGFSDYAVGAKPLDVFAARWRDYLASVRDDTAQVAVIGGGVAGVELALAMHHAMTQKGLQPHVSIIEAQGQITGVSGSAKARLERALSDAGIRCHFNATVTEICKDHVRLETGDPVPATLTVGAAGAFPHAWLQATALPLTNGFIEVNADLSVSGHPSLFAVGDCAHMRASPRPKAGVFAVRSAPVLHDNLRSVLMGQSTRPFKPQSRYLKLISLGRKSAIAERGGLSLSADILWQWKDRIDRAFMDKFTDFPPMRKDIPIEAAQGVKPALSEAPLCGGCGAKVSGDLLSDELELLPATARKDVTLGIGDDAAVLSFGEVRQVISTDHLRAFTEDPEALTRIAALHALGDVWAMGAQPQALVMNVTLPRMSEPLQRRTMATVLGAAHKVAGEVGAALVGGHSSMGAEMSIGFTVTGLLDVPPLQKAGAKPGDHLLLTRPLGSGVLLAAEMQTKVNGRHIAALFEHLCRSQAALLPALRLSNAATDVTGFGLAGHLAELCTASGTGAELDLAAVPFYDGVLEMVEAGVQSSLFAANRKMAAVEGPASPEAALLFDPQTAGGFLMSISENDIKNVLEAIQNAGFSGFEIGRVTDQPGPIRLR